ncbi:ABC transporter ATP-binding protein [Thermogemmatispora carboxidivorans]|uniref:ABC transporter ATP-binding protein n=1 Tax=Thermogemmatispora carboxidivorans TaxID=1382306 RepID=UPI0009DE36A5|nr:ABC transporter ATP-binding protein [Thermogemmatispora carboxidivorans]
MDSASRQLTAALNSDQKHETALLEVEHLESGYDETRVLWDISLEVHRGELVALVGANGAGKSTLLATLSGLLPAWIGHVRFAGYDITHRRAEEIVRLGLSHVPQGRRLFSALTVEENLLLGAYTRRAGSQQAIKQELEEVYTLLPKLRERRRQLAGSLSGGEQQMCAIGRGLMSHPELLLIDELSLGLAPQVVDDLLSALDAIHREKGLSLLLVEQDVQIALERADRAYVIENGHIVLEGTGSALLQNERVRTAYLGA